MSSSFRAWWKGRIAALRLVIAPGGCVEGDVIAQEVVINGRLNGRVFAPNVSIEASAEVEGRIFHTTISVERGARGERSHALAADQLL